MGVAEPCGDVETEIPVVLQHVVAEFQAVYAARPDEMVNYSENILGTLTSHESTRVLIA